MADVDVPGSTECSESQPNGRYAKRRSPERTQRVADDHARRESEVRTPLDDPEAKGAEDEAHRQFGGPVLRIEHRVHLDDVERR